MRLRHLIILACVCVGAASCASEPRPKDKQPAEEARARWNNTRATVLHGLGRDQFNAGNFEASRKTVDEALRISPESPELHILSAKLDIEQGRFEPADRSLRTAQQLAPTNPEPDYLLGVIYQRWQKTQQAYDFYAAASAKAPNELAYLLAQSEMLVQLGRSEDGLELLQNKVVFFENSSAIRDAVGQLLMQQKRYGEAVEMFRQANVLADGDPTLEEHLALALYHHGNWREASTHLARLTAGEDRAGRADLWLALGESQMQLGRFADARASFESASNADPSMTAAWLGIAKSAMRLNDHRRAEMSIRKALVVDPGCAEAMLMSGYLRLKQNNLAEAMSSFKRASSLNPADPVSLCMVGVVYERMGRKTEAAEYYGRALRASPRDPLAAQLLSSLDLSGN